MTDDEALQRLAEAEAYDEAERARQLNLIEDTIRILDSECFATFTFEIDDHAVKYLAERVLRVLEAEVAEENYFYQHAVGSHEPVRQTRR